MSNYARSYDIIAVHVTIYFRRNKDWVYEWLKREYKYDGWIKKQTEN